MAYTMDSTLKDLLKDPKVKPVLNQFIPGIADNPMLSMVEGMSLKAIVEHPMAGQMGITKGKVQQLLDAANKVA